MAKHRGKQGYEKGDGGLARTGAGLCVGAGPLSGRPRLHYVCVPDLQGLKRAAVVESVCSVCWLWK